MYDEIIVGCEMDIGATHNNYGGVGITKQDGRFFWGVGCDGEYAWEQIPESLYIELRRFGMTGITKGE